ncbi:uncharacterized protein [Montipora capricornis]|uniref:uncharacterized protein n=1 Tax=Montipora capricornis TaxID=246305 RepID=UPI0035F18F08
MELTKRLWDAKGYAELNKSYQNLRDQYAKIMNAASQPESQFLNNELGNQTMTTTTGRSGTIDGNENTTTTEQSCNEPSEEYITMANNAKKWYEITSQVKERNWSERTSSTFCKNVPNNKDIKELGNIASNLITLDPKEHPRDYLWQSSQQHDNLATQDFEQFWRSIWETAASENLESKWIKEIRSILQSHAPAQSTESVVITAELYYNSIKKKKNWSSPGKDKITNFWIKKLTALHPQIATSLTEIINKELSLPSWLQEGRCIMIPKKEEPAAKDHRPITCLNTLYKAVTSVIDELLKEHEATHQLMQIDQKI